jgi:hypothetical protein
MLCRHLQIPLSRIHHVRHANGQHRFPAMTARLQRTASHRPARQVGVGAVPSNTSRNEATEKDNSSSVDCTGCVVKTSFRSDIQSRTRENSGCVTERDGFDLSCVWDDMTCLVVELDDIKAVLFQQLRHLVNRSTGHCLFGATVLNSGTFGSMTTKPEP